MLKSTRMLALLGFAILFKVHSSEAWMTGPAPLRRLSSSTCTSSASRIGTTPLHAHNRNHFDGIPSLPKSVSNPVSSAMASALIASTSIASTLPLPARADPSSSPVVELSRGAVVIQTTSEYKTKSTIDSKSLLKTLFSNRKELSASFQRMENFIQDELTSSAAWKSLLQEVLEIQGNLANSIQIKAPQDLRETVRDISKGKLNLLVNGEVINISVEPSFGDREDELVLRVKGFKGEKSSFLEADDESTVNQGPRYGPIRTYLSRYEPFWNWWSAPYPSQYLLPGMQASNGDIILVGTAGTIWLIYVAAYMYYEFEREQVAKEAEAKKKNSAEAKKKKQKAVATPTQKEVKKKQSEDAPKREETSSPEEKSQDAPTSAEKTKVKQETGEKEMVAEETKDTVKTENTADSNDRSDVENASTQDEKRSTSSPTKKSLGKRLKFWRKNQD